MKKIIIISIVVIILGGGAFWYFNKSGTVDPATGEKTSGFKSFFTFGNTAPSNDTQTNTNDAGGEVLPNETGALDQNNNLNTAKLKQVTDFAVAGVVTFMDTRPTDESLTPPNEAKPAEVVVETPVVETKAPAKKADPKAKPVPKVVVPKVELPKVDIVPALRFVARANGHIYEQYLDTLASAKISNTTIPTIHEAIFAKEGQFVMYRYLNNLNDTIQSFFGTLGGETSGAFLPENIASVSTAPSGAQFFYLVPIGNDIAGYVGSFTDNKRTQIFTSSFTEWNPEWAQPNTIFMTTKPSYLFRGSIYSLNKLTGGFTKIFGGIYGLTTLVSPSNSILYSNSESGAPVLGLYNITSHSFSPTGISTITDKCVWSSNGIDIYCAVPNDIPKGQYPDSWYQGLVSFSDSIVKINSSNLSSIEIINTENINALDATNLTLSPDEKTLFMINKKDSTLWSLDLN